MRRFHYHKKEGEGNGWEVVQWSDDAEVPDYVDFDPDEHDEDDDMETFEEEEALAVNSREDDVAEEADLKNEVCVVWQLCLLIQDCSQFGLSVVHLG